MGQQGQRLTAAVLGAGPFWLIAATFQRLACPLVERPRIAWIALPGFVWSSNAGRSALCYMVRLTYLNTPRGTAVLARQPIATRQPAASRTSSMVPFHRFVALPCCAVGRGDQETHGSSSPASPVQNSSA